MSKASWGLKPKTKISKPRLGVFLAAFAIVGGAILLFSLASPNPNLLGDLNGDNVVNAADLSILLSNYGTTNSVADINGDGQVSVADLSILLSNFGRTITAAKPAIPTGLVATPADGSVKLTWSSNPSTDNVDTYQVYVNDSTNPPSNLNVTGTSYTVTGLTNNTSYNFRVSAHNSAGYGDWSTTPVAATPVGSGGSVLFDGRAQNMTSMDVHEVTASTPGAQGPITWSQYPYGTHYFNISQTPNVWSCLCFIKNDITLGSDSTFGKVYNVNVATGDTNEWQGSSVSAGAAQLSESRPQADDLGKWNYFAMADKVPSWNGPIGDLYYVDLGVFGYQTSEGDQVALRLWNGPNDAGPLQYSVQVNAGFINAPSGYQPGSTQFEDAIMPVTFGQWDEWVVAVKGATDNTGGIQVYHKTLSGSWSMVYEKLNIPTELYGTIGTQNYAADGSNWSVIDKIGLYFTEYGGESESVQESGLTRSNSLSAAESTLP